VCLWPVLFAKLHEPGALPTKGMEYKNLPLVQLEIDPNDESDVEVDYVALVDKPAIEKNFIAFSATADFSKVKLDFTDVNNQERIVLGPAMIPDMPIYRKNPDGTEYYVVFSKETVKNIAEKFYRKGFQNNANLMHDPSLKQDGVCYFLSFIRDSTKGMIGLSGDYPEGTWFLGAKINNDAVWQLVQDETIKGFSVEGIFQYKKPKVSAEDALRQIGELLNQIEL
jgi:hypothetical protein